MPPRVLHDEFLGHDSHYLQQEECEGPNRFREALHWHGFTYPVDHAREEETDEQFECCRRFVRRREMEVIGNI